MTVTAHTMSLGMVIKPEVSQPTVLRITDDLYEPGRRARELRVPIARAAGSGGAGAGG